MYTRYWGWILLCAFVLSLPGCGGCSSKTGATTAASKAAEEKKKKEEEERKKKEEEEKKKKEKPNFEIGIFATLPNTGAMVETAFKPGHWTAATNEILANNFDLQGELYTDPFQLDGMPYKLGTSRPVVLPKGQKKKLELTFYVPPGRRGDQIVTRLTPKGSTRELIQSSHKPSRMPDHQFHFLVLAASADKYAFLDKNSKLDSIRPADGGWEKIPQYYRMSLPKLDNSVPLPHNSITWTSIAYIVWDGIQPILLTEEQQQAMVDWLHWGGQLIISGPDSLDSLQTKGGFLEPYLPAKGEKDVEYTQADMQRFSDEWTLGGTPLKVIKAWSGKKLAPADDPSVRVLASTAADGGDPLVVERLVGRGRIVLTAFRLAQKELATNWESFDGFFNCCLLRRPGRRFTYRVEDGIETKIQIDWVGDYSSRLDPKVVSTYRMFSRDAKASPQTFADEGVSVANSTTEVPEDRPQGIWEQLSAFGQSEENQPALIGAGVAGWNPFNDTSELARHSLRRAAGIRIPDARFIIYVLVVYVVVLVPLNWLVCWLLGRVEWAWVAAPIVTVICAVAVVYLAQLDIGFARARTEVAVIELHGNHARAHITRYTALYTSLSTTYDLKFADPNGVAQPFPLFSRGDEKGQEVLRGQTSTTVHYRRDGDDVTLAGFSVASNSSGLLHTEQMLNVGGSVRLRKKSAGGYDVVNDTRFNLRGAAVIGPGGICYLGDMAPGASAKLEFVEASKLDHWKKYRDPAAATSRFVSPDQVNVRLLVKLAEDQRSFAPGETRLVAFTEDALDGLEIEPQASQSRFGSLVVAHLQYAQLGAPAHDVNSRVQIEKQKDKIEAEREAEAEKAGVGAADGE